MNDATTAVAEGEAPGAHRREQRDGNRLWAASGIAFVALFAGGIFFADVLAASQYPGFGMPDADIVSYFSESRFEMRALSLLHSLAAIALVVFAIHLWSVFSGPDEGDRRAGGLVLATGVLAAAFLLLSALLFWVLALPATIAHPDLLRVLLAFSYLAGGPPGLVLPLAVFVGAASVLATRRGSLPRWVSSGGKVVGVVGSLSCVAVLDQLLGMDHPFWTVVLLPSMVLAVAWILVASAVLTARVGYQTAQ